MIFTIQVLCDGGETVVFDVLAASEAHALELAEEEALERLQRPVSGEILEAAVA